MNVSIGARWEQFVEAAVSNGRYGSASEVVREGLRLVEEREARLEALRQTLNTAIADGGAGDAAQLATELAAKAEALAEAGF
jgi:antitoxin ParD1/3/4